MYQLHIKGIVLNCTELYWTVLYCTVLYCIVLNCVVLYYWSSLRCIKNWIMINCRGLKFPHRAAVLLVLERDGACTGLNGLSARRSAVLVLVWCYIAGVTENRICECADCLKAALSSGMTGLQAMVAAARSVSRGSNETVTLLYLVRCPGALT